MLEVIVLRTLEELRELPQDEWQILVYCLGLAAAGLLAFKKGPADRAASLLLALMWGIFALLVWQPREGASVWVVLAALQAVLLVAIGTASGKLELPARSGPWAVAGTSLILYSLVVFPFLNGFLQVNAFKDAPFPLVLFTCGFLLFSAKRVGDLLLALPILWALLGGPSLYSDSGSEMWGLRSALLVGTLFVLFPPQLRRRSDHRLPPGMDYRLAYRNRAAFGYGLWGLVLVTGLLLFLSFAAGGHGPGRETVIWLPRVTLNLVLVCALGIAFWLAFPAWQSLWFRNAAWLTARIGGRVWVWLRASWRWGLLFILLTALAASFLPGEKPQTAPAKTGKPGSISSQMNDTLDFLARFLPAEDAIRLAGAIGLLWLLYESYQGRRRLVIGSFDNKTGEAEAQATWVTGLGARLQNELARIADLYRVIDEPYPTRRSSKVVEVVPGVEDVGNILKQAISTTFASFKIVEQLAEIFTRITSRPHLTGAVHKVGKDYVITAEVAGGGLGFSWQVDSRTLSEGERKLAEKDMSRILVEELAFRVATDLVPIGSPRWRAVRCFTNGLRFFRETHRQNNRYAKLREAEHCLIRALSDDQRFTQCHFNLGVVYRQLGELGSAESAFRLVLREDPDNFEACYALAETLVHAEQHDEAVRICEAAIGIDSSDARAWDLLAYALLHREQKRKNVEVALPPDHLAWNRIREKSEIAVALAWRSLCLQMLQGASAAAVRKETKTVLHCTRNLAVVLTRAGMYQESEQMFRQAAWLAPHDPDLRLYEGRTLFWDRRWECAETALDGTFDEGLETVDRGLLWSTLAQVHSRSGPEPARHDAARLAHQRFLDLAAGASPEEIKQLIELSLEAPPRQPNDGRREGAS